MKKKILTFILTIKLIFSVLWSSLVWFILPFSIKKEEQTSQVSTQSFRPINRFRQLPLCQTSRYGKTVRKFNCSVNICKFLPRIQMYLTVIPFSPQTQRKKQIFNFVFIIEYCVAFLRNQAAYLYLPFKVYYPVNDQNPVVVMTWEGEMPELPSIMLNSHMDVVPVYPGLKFYLFSDKMLKICNFAIAW